MTKTTLSLTLAATALLVGGCLPDEFIWWSGDGQTAAVRTADGLRLADGTGRLSPVLLPGEIESAAWFPDGSALVVSRSFQVTNWAAVENLIPREEVEATMRLARAIPDLLKAGLTAADGSWDKVEEAFLKPLGMTESAALEPAWFCALQLHREQILDVSDGATNAASLRAEILASETNGLPVYEISLLTIANGGPTGEPRALVRSLNPLLDPILSPQHAVLAFRSQKGSLRAVTLDGRPSFVVAEEDVRCAAWSADGRALIHVIMRESAIVGEIRSRALISASGEVQEDAPAETLAMSAFAATPAPRLAVLPDGRILFPSLPITLPARTASIEPVAQFFLLNPSAPNAAPVAVAIQEGSLPGDLSTFSVSPDGRFVAVVEGGTDVVAVLELATGKVHIISPAHAGWKSRLIPAWRNDHELTFARPSSTGTRPELVLWQANAPEQILSNDWPGEVVKPWLEAP